MKLLTILIYLLLSISWLYILIFSIKEIIKNKFTSKSLFTILFLILIIDSLRTIIESFYFGTSYASQYGILPINIFEILSNPYLVFIPKFINMIASIAIIFVILKKWYPKKFEEENKLKIEQENLNSLIKAKTKELEELNKKLQEKVLEEVEKNKLQEQKLFAQSKMAAMGEMLSNVAHQWRQPLSTISAISSGIVVRYHIAPISQEEIIKDMEQITLTTKHMSQTIVDFQDFFKPEEKNSEFIFADLIKGTLDIVNPMIKAHHINIEINISCMCKIQGPLNECKQVLMNLISNSKDAFEGKFIDKKLIRIFTSVQNNNCTIKITDNAGGIPNEIIDRIFEPYFTTKHKSQGTGLGLYMSRQIIEKHMYGSLEVKNVDVTYSEKTYKGTEFTIVVKSTETSNL